MTKRGKRSASAQARLSSRRSGPAASAVSYSGPMRPDNDRNDTYTTYVARTLQVSIPLTAGAGSVATVFQSTDAYTLGAITGFMNEYEEWRVLGLEVEFIPVSDGFSPALSLQTGTNAVITPIWMAPFHEDATSLTTQAIAANVGGHKKTSITRALDLKVRMDETDESEWAPTGANLTHPFGIATYVGCAGMTTGGSSVALGTFFVAYVVQFRRRRSYAATVALRALSSSEQDLCTDGQGERKVAGGDEVRLWPAAPLSQLSNGGPLSVCLEQKDTPPARVAQRPSVSQQAVSSEFLRMIGDYVLVPRRTDVPPAALTAQAATAAPQ